MLVMPVVARSDAVIAMRRGREIMTFAVAVIVVGVILAGCVSQENSSGHPGNLPSAANSALPSRNHSISHILITQDAVDVLAANGATSAAFVRSLNQPGTFEIIPADRKETDLLPSATHVESFKSYQAIRQAFASGTMLPGVRIIQYDDEHWRGTPLTEQQHPFIYVRLAEELVHEHSLLFMNTPGADLEQLLDPEAGNQYDAYLQEHLATLAKYADLFEIQAQNAKSVGQYVNFATQAIQQAKEANKSAIVLLGITAKSNGPSSSDLINEIEETVGKSDGYWFNIPSTSHGSLSGISAALPVVQNLARLLSQDYIRR